MDEIFKVLDVDRDFEITGEGKLSSCFSVTELATTTLASVGKAISSLVYELGENVARPQVKVNRRLASLWFARSIYPIGWEMPPVWDAIAGDYEAKDGWIKLHTNLSHHRLAALKSLGCANDKGSVTHAVKHWTIDDLETAIIGNGGVAAAMRSQAAWGKHPQGIAVAAEPLIDWGDTYIKKVRSWPASAESPLNGLHVLDLTRVLAGPVATRTLAGFGADVLRVDPLDWDEPNVVPDVTLGKRCCRLDLKDDRDRQLFNRLLKQADILVHGYRPDALEQLGYGADIRRQIAPDLIEVSLDAYGWSGPWAKRRGFDSLVQMSCGIAHTRMEHFGDSKPTPLPVQALDHATGYLMAAAVITAISAAIKGEGGGVAKVSLARTAELLLKHPQDETDSMNLVPTPTDYCDTEEKTPWGMAYRLKAPLEIEGSKIEWQRPPCDLGSSEPSWN